MSNWIPFLLVLSESCLTKLLSFFFSTYKNNSGSSSCTPSSKANLFPSTLLPILDEQQSQSPLYPTSTITISSSKFLYTKFGKPFVRSTFPNLADLSFSGSLLWNTIDDEINLAPSLEKFKKEVCNWNGISCTCFICN